MANKIKKDCTLTPGNVEYVCAIKKERNCGSFSEALDLIIKEHQEAEPQEELIANKVMEKLNSEHFEMLGRLRRNINAADYNSQVILEVLNTLIISLEIPQAYSIKEIKAKALTTAEDEVKKKIAYLKQVKDSNPSKQKNAKNSTPKLL